MPAGVINFGVLVALASGVIIASLRWREGKEIPAVLGFALGMLVMYLLVVMFLGFQAPAPSLPIITATPAATNSPTATATLTRAPTPTVSSSLSLNSLPHECSGWQTPDTDDKWYNLRVLNTPNSRMPSYQFGFSMPALKPNQWSGLGFQCYFELQNLSEYTYLKIRISFSDKDTVCNFELKDHENKIDTVLLGLGVAVSSDITVTTLDKTQIITIPLNKYYNSINRKFIKAVGCFSTSDQFQGKHDFTLEEIEFLK